MVVNVVMVAGFRQRHAADTSAEPNPARSGGRVARALSTPLFAGCDGVVVVVVTTVDVVVVVTVGGVVVATLVTVAMLK